MQVRPCTKDSTQTLRSPVRPKRVRKLDGAEPETPAMNQWRAGVTSADTQKREIVERFKEGPGRRNVHWLCDVIGIKYFWSSIIFGLQLSGLI